MNFETLPLVAVSIIGFIGGFGACYVWWDFRLRRDEDSLSERLYRCSIEVARAGVSSRLDDLPDEEIVRRILSGLEVDPGANGKNR